MIKKIEIFFEEQLKQINFKKNSLFFCRNDGVVLYQKNGFGLNNNSSVGALLAGVWQAAEALTTFIPKSKRSDEFFRLSFDTSANGIYIVPIKIQQKDYYLTVIYYQVLNPAQLKSQLRGLLNRFKNFLDSELSNTQHSDNQGEYLFKDISDDEINELFAFTGR